MLFIFIILYFSSRVNLKKRQRNYLQYEVVVCVVFLSLIAKAKLNRKLITKKLINVKIVVVSGKKVIEV